MTMFLGVEDPLRFTATDHPRRVLLARPLVAVGSALISLVASIGPPNVVHSAERIWARIAQRYLHLTVDVDGTEHIDSDRTYVVAPLHEGFADAIALLRLPLNFRFAARDELFAWPLLGPYLHVTGHPSVPTRPTPSSLRQFYDRARSVIDGGDSLVVFAQGTILGIETSFQSGALRLATTLGVPLLPVVLTGGHRVWEHPFTSTLRFDQTMSVRVLPPIEPQDLDLNAFRRAEAEMKARAIQPDMAPARRFNPDVDGWWDGYRFDIDPIHRDLANRFARRRRDRDTEAE